MLRAFGIQAAVTGGSQGTKAWGFSLLSSVSPGTAATEVRATPWQGVSSALSPLILMTTHFSDEETEA